MILVKSYIIIVIRSVTMQIPTLSQKISVSLENFYAGDP